jgi:hypothetical protein
LTFIHQFRPRWSGSRQAFTCVCRRFASPDRYLPFVLEGKRPSAAIDPVPNQIVVTSHNARKYQAVATKTIAGTEFRLILSKVTNSAELAKIDPDTGLQEDVGPSINRFLTLSARRHFSSAWLQMS